MNTKTYRKVRIAASFFTAMIVGLAVSIDNIILAGAGVLTGMLMMVIVRSKTDIQIDEREKIIREKSAQMAYAIFAPTIGLGSFFLILVAKDELYFLEAIGIVLAYLTLFLIALYSISHFFYSRKFGSDGKE
jgi:uncharacterized membrane protein